jgi:4'-phosphopantetheinyl transferase
MLVFPKTSRSHLTFSLSHSADRALIAIADGRDIGIDLERRRDVDATALAKRFFTKAEHRAIANLPSDRQQSEFFRYWVVKEAILKGQGVGLRSLDRCELEFVFAGEQARTRNATDSLEPKWSARILPCGHGWEGAVASLGSDWQVMYFHRMGRTSHWPM